MQTQGHQHNKACVTQGSSNHVSTLRKQVLAFCCSAARNALCHFRRVAVLQSFFPTSFMLSACNSQDSIGVPVTMAMHRQYLLLAHIACHVTYLLLCLQHLHCLCCIGQVNGCRVLPPPHHQTCLLDSSSLQLLEALLLLMHKLLLCCRPTLSGVHPVPPFMSLPA